MAKRKEEDFEPRTTLGFGGDGVSPIVETGAVNSPVGGKYGSAYMRSLNMGKKSKSPSASELLQEDELHGTTRGKKGVLNIEDYYKKGGKVSSASKRGDGIAQRGKTKGRFV